MDWLAVWGETSAVGFAFKEVLLELAEDAARDYVKLFFKDWFDERASLDDKLVLQVAAGKAVTEFLKLVQQELEDSDLDELQVVQYVEPVKKLVFHEEIAPVLGIAFKPNSTFDSWTVSQTWKSLDLLPLPDVFDWRQVGKRYARKVKAILQDSPELQALLDSPIVVEKSPSQADYLDLLKYRGALQEFYGNLRLDSLDTSGAAYNELKLWRIFVPQTVRYVQEFVPQVYEFPKEHQQRLIDSGELEEEELSAAELEEYKEDYYQQQNRSVLDVVNDPDYPYLVILGDPGSGKSTLLQYLALRWVEVGAGYKPAPTNPIPLLIELRTYVRFREAGSENGFLDFFQSEASVIRFLDPSQLEMRLKSGEVLLLFDGLDEVFDPQLREEIIGEVMALVQQYPQVRAIATSRVIGYKQKRLREAGFSHFMLQDLEPSQVQDFINRWHDLTFYDRLDKQRKQQRLETAIKESVAIRELSGNPLLLTMMAILNRHQELPRDRAELYNQSSRVLLHQWDAERALIDAKLAPLGIDYKDKQAMLRKVAYFMQQNSSGLAGNAIFKDDLLGILTDYFQNLSNLQGNDPREMAEVMVRQLRERNFILCFLGSDYYAFVHRTFLEYFCAWEFIWRFEKEQDISLEKLKLEVFGKHWQDESWHEVLRLIAGMLDAKFVGEILEYLMAQQNWRKQYTHLLITAQCLAEVKNRSTIMPITEKLLHILQDLANKKLKADTARQVVNAIATTWPGDPNTKYWLKTCAESNRYWRARIVAIQELVKGWKENQDVFPFVKELALSDKNKDVRIAVMRELVKGWKDNQDVLSFIKELALSDKNKNLRIAALREVATSWNDRPTSLALIKQCTISDKDLSVRQEAIKQLATYWKDDPDTLAILKQRAMSDEDRFVQQEAVKQLATIWKDNPDNLAILIQLAVFKDMSVRQEAIKQLATIWKDDPDDLAILKQLAVSKDMSVRQETVKQLATDWKDDPDTLVILKQLSVFDEDGNVRQEAVKQLVTGWKDNPDTFTFLIQLAVSKDIFIRQEVVKQLAIDWKDDADTLAILKQCSVSKDISVRQEAVKQLAKDWKDDPDTLAFLKQAAVSNHFWDVQQEAVKQLAIGWKDDPDTLAFLKQCVVSDNFWDVRQEAVKQLVTGWKDDPDTLAFLKQDAISDKSWYVRQEVVKQLATGWKDDPDTLAFIKQCAVSDEDRVVRQEAVKQLAIGWKDEPDALVTLKQYAVSDKSWDVRQEAVKQLAIGWKDEPEMFTFLWDILINNLLSSRCFFGYENSPQAVLEVILENYPHYPQIKERLHDMAKNSPDKYLRKFARKKLALY